MKAVYLMSVVRDSDSLVFSRTVYTSNDIIKATRIINKEQAQSYLGLALMKELTVKYDKKNKEWTWEVEQ